MMDVSKVTRFEVIYGGDKEVYDADFGRRLFFPQGCSIELSLQDAGQTLKVFVSDNPTKIYEKMSK